MAQVNLASLAEWASPPTMRSANANAYVCIETGCNSYQTIWELTLDYGAASRLLVILRCKPFGPISPVKSASVYECFPFIWPYNAHPGQVTQKPVAGLPTQVMNDNGRYRQRRLNTRSLRLLSCLPRLENSKYLKCLLKRETFGPYSSLGIIGVDHAFHPLSCIPKP